MKKVFKIILGLTKTVVDPLSIQPRVGTKNSLVMGAVDKVGLITGQFTKPLMWPIWIDSFYRSFLNPSSFLKGVDYENDIYKNIPRNYDNG